MCVCVAQCKVNRQRKNCIVTRKRVCVVFFFCMTVFVHRSCRMNWLRTRWKRKNVSERNLMCVHYRIRLDGVEKQFHDCIPQSILFTELVAPFIQRVRCRIKQIITCTWSKSNFLSTTFFTQKWTFSSVSMCLVAYQYQLIIMGMCTTKKVRFSSKIIFNNFVSIRYTSYVLTINYGFHWFMKRITDNKNSGRYLLYVGTYRNWL